MKELAASGTKICMSTGCHAWKKGLMGEDLVFWRNVHWSDATQIEQFGHKDQTYNPTIILTLKHGCGSIVFWGVLWKSHWCVSEH